MLYLKWQIPTTADYQLFGRFDKMACEMKEYENHILVFFYLMVTISSSLYMCWIYIIIQRQNYLHWFGLWWTSILKLHC